LNDQGSQGAGVAYSVAASVLFAVMYYYVTLLAPLDAQQIYGWRILLTAPFLVILLRTTGHWDEVVVIWRRVLEKPALVPLLLVSSFLVGVQIWIFMWAPLHGYGLDVSLGFFLLPLTMVLTGRFVFHERISSLQKAACLVAALGVANEFLFAPRVSWPTFLVALGYPIYFVLRRRLQTNNLGGMWIDLALSVPVGVAFVSLTSGAGGLMVVDKLWLGVLIVGLGCISSAGLTCMFVASHRLNFALYGLLNYVEPVLLVIVSLLLGERIAPGQWGTYVPIWIAIAILAAEGIGALRVRQSGRPLSCER